MKNYKYLFLLLFIPVFLSFNLNLNNKPKLTKSIRIVSNANKDLKNIDPAVYEVKFTYTGYVSFYGDSPDCPVGSGGKVTLKGLLKGDENIPRSDDVLYEGNLQLDIDIAICSSKRLLNGEDVLCAIYVKGSGLVNTMLEIYYDGRGGYIQIKDTTKLGFTKHVGGSCDTEQTDEERKMVPLQTIASIFNGLEIPNFTNRTLYKTHFVISEELGITEVEISPKF
jgi:hypothetical protein